MKIALLDDVGVLTGYSTDKDAEGIAVPDDCELKPEEYRWTGIEFVPNRKARLHDPMAPIALGLIAVRDSKLIDLPRETLIFLKGYE